MEAKEQATPRKKLSHNQELVLCAMFITLVYVFTTINVNPLGIPGGLVHLGNIPFYIAAILFGKKIGAISGGFGMALYDVLSPYAIWAPATLIIGLVSGFAMGAIAHKKPSFPKYIAALIVAAVFKVVGYYIAEAIIYGNWISPALSIPANLMQVAVASVVVLIIIKPLDIAAQKIIYRS